MIKHKRICRCLLRVEHGREHKLDQMKNLALNIKHQAKRWSHSQRNKSSVARRPETNSIEHCSWRSSWHLEDQSASQNKDLVSWHGSNDRATRWRLCPVQTQLKPTRAWTTGANCAKSTVGHACDRFSWPTAKQERTSSHHWRNVSIPVSRRSKNNRSRIRLSGSGRNILDASHPKRAQKRQRSAVQWSEIRRFLCLLR